MRVDENARGRASAGKSNIWLVLLIIAVAIFLVLAAQLGPQHYKRWKLKGKLENILLDDYRRYNRTYGEGMALSGDAEYQLWSDLGTWCQEKNIPLDPMADTDPPPCTIDAELWQPGKIECHYMIDLTYLVFKRTVEVQVVGEVKKVYGY